MAESFASRVLSWWAVIPMVSRSQNRLISSSGSGPGTSEWRRLTAAALTETPDQFPLSIHPSLEGSRTMDGDRRHGGLSFTVFQ